MDPSPSLKPYPLNPTTLSSQPASKNHETPSLRPHNRDHPLNARALNPQSTKKDGVGGPWRPAEASFALLLGVRGSSRVAVNKSE